MVSDVIFFPGIYWIFDSIQKRKSKFHIQVRRFVDINMFLYIYAKTTKISCKYNNLKSEVNAWEVNVEQCFRSDLIMEHLAANKGSTKSAGFLSLCKKRALL